MYDISSWIDDPISNIPLKVQIQRYRCLKLDIFRFIFRQWVLEECILPSHYVGAHTVKNYIKFQVGLTLQLAIFPLKSKYKDTDVWNLTYWIFMFRQSALEECILPSLNVWPHIPRKYTIFQVGLTLHLVIFLSKYKYKDTDVWNLTYSDLFFGSGFLKNAFCLVLKFDLIFHENIQYFKLDWRSN